MSDEQLSNETPIPDDDVEMSVDILSEDDLEPIAESYVNNLVSMSADEAKRLSPVHYQPQRNIPVLLRVGEHEPSEFHRQSELLREKWASHATVSFATVPGRDHFDLLEELDMPGGSLLQDARALLQLSRT